MGIRKFNLQGIQVRIIGKISFKEDFSCLLSLSDRFYFF
jgi:hypothetical protein